MKSELAKYSEKVQKMLSVHCFILQKNYSKMSETEVQKMMEVLRILEYFGSFRTIPSQNSKNCIR